MDVRKKLVELLTNSPQLDVLDCATGWEEFDRTDWERFYERLGER